MVITAGVHHAGGQHPHRPPQFDASTAAASWAAASGVSSVPHALGSSSAIARSSTCPARAGGRGNWARLNSDAHSAAHLLPACACSTSSPTVPPIANTTATTTAPAPARPHRLCPRRAAPPRPPHRRRPAAPPTPTPPTPAPRTRPPRPRPAAPQPARQHPAQAAAPAARPRARRPVATTARPRPATATSPAPPRAGLPRVAASLPQRPPCPYHLAHRPTVHQLPTPASQPPRPACRGAQRPYRQRAPRHRHSGTIPLR